MKKFKCMIFMMLLFFAVEIGSVSVNAAVINKTPASIVAELTGKTLDEVVQESMETGKSYARIAKDNGKLSEYKKEYLKLQESILQDDVTKGYITQAEADTILAEIKASQALGYDVGAIGAYRGHGCHGGYGRYGRYGRYRRYCW